MIEIKNAKNLSEQAIQNIAKEISNDHPGQYVVITAAFGLHATVSARLNIFAPDDSYFGWHVRNGKVRQFTTKQKIAAQNATPTLY
jgi:hypothetical protein